MSDTNVTMELKDTETETKDEVSISKQDLLTLLNLLQVSAQRLLVDNQHSSSSLEQIKLQIH